MKDELKEMKIEELNLWHEILYFLGGFQISNLKTHIKLLYVDGRFGWVILSFIITIKIGLQNFGSPRQWVD